MEILIRIVLVLVLILLNGYFVASEFALVSVRKTRIDELVKRGNRTAKLIQRAQRNIESVISAAQLGVTVSSLLVGWFGEPAVASLIFPLLRFLPSQLLFFTAHTIASIIAFLFITYLLIVLGELAPKTLALQKSEFVSQVIIAPLVFFSTLFKPFILLLNLSGKFVLGFFGLTAPGGHNLVHSEQEIKMILAQSGESGVIPEKEVEMVYNVFRLGDIPIKSIMVPRTDIIGFSSIMTLSEVVREIRRNPHSRFPIYKETVDKIIGFIHVKDIYQKVLHNKNTKTIEELKIIREILSVPETKKADQVLRDMRKKRIHIAVVLDEFGGTEGIVTLEDVLESLVGEIHDEFENPLQDIQKREDGSWLVDGRTPIDTIQSLFNFQIKGQGYTTIGGLIFGLLGRQPKKGESVAIGSLTFTIESVDGRRIKNLVVSAGKMI